MTSRFRRHPKRDHGRDSGGFVALPWSVLDSPAYLALSHPARSLLLEFARQFVRDNNGRLLASSSYLSPRGWKSADVVTRAKRELLEAGFIFETVKGHRPNKASWYAVTWRALDKLAGYDAGAERGFIRSAYQTKPNMSIESFIPARGISKCFVATPNGAPPGTRAPSGGPITTDLVACIAPRDGIHLEMPSSNSDDRKEGPDDERDK